MPMHPVLTPYMGSRSKVVLSLWASIPQPQAAESSLARRCHHICHIAIGSMHASTRLRCARGDSQCGLSGTPTPRDGRGKGCLMVMQWRVGSVECLAYI